MGLALGLWLAVLVFVVVWDARRHATDADDHNDQRAADDAPDYRG